MLEKMSKNWYLESNWSARRLQRELLLNEADEGHTILDIGSGMGRTIGQLKEQGKNVIGVDIDPELIEEAKRVNKGVKYIRADGSKLPFKEGVFDEVILENVIEHIKNQKEVISETQRVLVEGGMLIISTPNKYIYRMFMYLRKIRDLEFDMTWLTNPVPDHIAELTPSQLKKLLTDFRKVKLKGINPYTKSENPWLGIDLMAVATK